MRWRPWLAAVAVIALLGVAGTAGAVVEGMVVTIKYGQWARLAGTNVYCEATVETKPGARRAQVVGAFPDDEHGLLDCGLWSGPRPPGVWHAPGSYSAEIGRSFIRLRRWPTVLRSVDVGIFYQPRP